MYANSQLLSHSNKVIAEKVVYVLVILYVGDLLQRPF